MKSPILMQITYEGQEGTTIMYADLRWASRLRRAWGHLWKDPEAMFHGMAIIPLGDGLNEASDLTDFN